MSDPSNLLHPLVRAALEQASIDFEAVACEPHLADTAEFCAHYGISPADACNAIVIVVKKEPKEYVACLARADTKLDVNHKVSAEVGFKRLSFAGAEETAELTGQMLGGVTVIGLPASIPLLIDRGVMERERVLVGGGNRSSKVSLDPRELLKLHDACVADLAVPR